MMRGRLRIFFDQVQARFFRKGAFRDCKPLPLDRKANLGQGRRPILFAK
jgi:hypothetical protein